MFFVKFGYVIAWGLVLLGFLRSAMGLIVALSDADSVSRAAASSHILGTATSGAAIDQGMMSIAAGVAFGLLSRIADNRT